MAPAKSTKEPTRAFTAARAKSHFFKNLDLNVVTTPVEAEGHAAGYTSACTRRRRQPA
jgi:hypothetical protein